jgi:small subunit ribosomal protein S5
MSDIDSKEKINDPDPKEGTPEEVVPAAEIKEEAAQAPAASPTKSYGRRDDRRRDSGDGFMEKVVKINRVAKVVKGGKNMSFNALVIVGDTKGKVGIGFGKSNEVVGAITKGTLDAKKSLQKINLKGDSIPHEVLGKFKATSVFLMPAGAGTGVIAGGSVRAMCDCVGIKNILTKTIGSRNPVNVVKATMDGFGKLRLTRKG